jgi:hypothetical protein
MLVSPFSPDHPLYLLKIWLSNFYTRKPHKTSAAVVERFSDVFAAVALAGERVREAGQETNV